MNDYSTMNSEMKTVDILDARKHQPGPFSETGFTLISLDQVLGLSSYF